MLRIACSYYWQSPYEQVLVHHLNYVCNVQRKFRLSVRNSHTVISSHTRAKTFDSPCSVRAVDERNWVYLTRLYWCQVYSVLSRITFVCLTKLLQHSVKSGYSWSARFGNEVCLHPWCNRYYFRNYFFMVTVSAFSPPSVIQITPVLRARCPFPWADELVCTTVVGCPPGPSALDMDTAQFECQPGLVNIKPSHSLCLSIPQSFSCPSYHCKDFLMLCWSLVIVGIDSTTVIQGNMNVWRARGCLIVQHNRLLIEWWGEVQQIWLWWFETYPSRH